MDQAASIDDRSDHLVAVKAMEDEYDQSTFFGRFRQFVDVINPITLFTSDATLRDAQQIVERAEKGESLDIGEVRKAKKLVAAGTPGSANQLDEMQYKQARSTI